jgi:hypothetical protein
MVKVQSGAFENTEISFGFYKGEKCLDYLISQD